MGIKSLDGYWIHGSKLVAPENKYAPIYLYTLSYGSTSGAALTIANVSVAQPSGSLTWPDLTSKAVGSSRATRRYLSAAPPLRHPRRRR
jgi:hypothetical protein